MTAQLMKGKTFREHGHRMTYPCWVEIKSDEIRAHVTVTPQGTWPVTFLSYAGKPLCNMEKFEEKFRALAKDSGICEFDCGFEANGTYNDSYRWVRSSKGLPDDLKDAPCRFFLFDIPGLDGTFEQRMVTRHNVFSMAWAEDFQELVLPIGTWAYKPEDVDTLFLKARNGGHEGLMVKSLQHEYKRGKRIDGWLKVKPEDDADGVIIEIIRAIAEDGTPHDRAGSVTIRVEDGSVASPHGLPHDLGRDMFERPEKYLGQWAEFKFMERDRQGGYRHPVWGRLREAKA